MILNKIVKYKKDVVNKLKEKHSYEELKELASSTKINAKNSFYDALSKNGLSLIAEVKKASPSKGIIRKDFDPVEIAKHFEKNNASAISVLTDEEFFKGKNKYLSDINKAVWLPLLRKDFIIDKIQIVEAKTIGASAILLIAAILELEQLKSFSSLANSLGMDVLLEVHNKEELEKALKTSARIIGINNRNLNDFTVDIENTTTLKKHIPSDRLIVSESGFKTSAELKYLQDNKIDAVLIGEGLATNPELISFFNK